MRIFLTYMFAFWATVLVAQNKQILYGVEEVPQSLLQNPSSRMEQKFHFGVPMLSQIHVNGGSSGVSAFDIFGTSSVDINTRIRNTIFDLKNRDFFTATQQLNIVDFGWRSKKDLYFSGGIYEELDFITYFPKDLAILAWEGNSNYLGYEFDLGELSTTAELLTVFHFGANKKVSRNLTVGVRGKIYSSILNARSTGNEGTFVTEVVDGSPNIYEHRIQDADIAVKTSGIGSLGDANNTASEIIKRSLLGGNLGLGLDIGATYEINRDWTASASLLDIGAIFYTKDVETYIANGDYTLDGIELLFPSLEEGESAIEYYDNLGADIENQYSLDPVNDSYTALRPLKFNAALKYSFGKLTGDSEKCDCASGGVPVKKKQAAGIQFYSINGSHNILPTSNF